jgi:hypothetical protein
MNQILIQLGMWFGRHTSEIAMGVVATLLTIYGNDINSYVRKFFKKNHFFVRFSAFILLCTLGYTLLTNFFLSFFNSWLGSLSPQNLALGVFATLGILAWIATSKGHV